MANPKIPGLIAKLLDLEKQMTTARNEYNHKMDILEAKMGALRGELKTALSAPCLPRVIPNLTPRPVPVVRCVPSAGPITIKQCKYMETGSKRCPNHVPEWQRRDFCTMHQKMIEEHQQTPLALDCGAQGPDLGATLEVLN